MSADPHGALDFPCQACDAPAGVQCSPDCEYSENAVGLVELIGTRPVEESLAVIASVVRLLPYGSLVGARGVGAPEPSDHDSEEYLDRLADWLLEYQPVIHGQIADLHAQSRQRISMQIERDVLDGVIRRALEGTP